MIKQSLELDSGGDVWLHEDDDSACLHVSKCLGLPRYALYDSLPIRFWAQLAVWIRERKEEEREEREYRDGIEDTYRSQKL